MAVGLGGPPLLIISTYVVFQTSVSAFGPRWGYLGGFLFFWTVWCIGFPIAVIGVTGIRSVLRDVRPRLPEPAWFWAVLLVIPVAGGFVVSLLPDLASATGRVVALALVIAVVNATLEEVLWRGVYVYLFPGRPIIGYLYPAVMFAFWHVSPTSVVGSTSTLVAGAAYLGLVYGWIAQRTGSIRVTIPAHIAVNAMGLSFAMRLLGID